MDEWLAKRFGRESASKGPAAAPAALRARSAERPKLPESAFRVLEFRIVRWFSDKQLI